MNKQIPADIADDELSALVACEHGYKKRLFALPDIYQWAAPGERYGGFSPPRFATSVDCVLPLLPKFGVRIDRNLDWFVEINTPELPYSEGHAPNLARACCLAMLAAKGSPVFVNPTQPNKHKTP